MEIFEINDLKNIQNKLNLLLNNAIKENSSLGFLNTLKSEDSETYWNSLQNDLNNSIKKLFIVKEKKHIIASVILSFCQSENASHRVEIEKLIVHNLYQGIGIATKLMLYVENIAKKHNKSLIILNINNKSDASFLYEKLEYKKAGQIPLYTLNNDFTYLDNIIYYKSI